MEDHNFTYSLDGPSHNMSRTRSYHPTWRILQNISNKHMIKARYDLGNTQNYVSILARK